MSNASGSNLNASNAAVLEFCERRCELLLAGLDGGAGLADRVRNRLLEGPPPFPDAAATARSMHMSERALRRRLQSEGTSFRTLVQEVRRQPASRYLRDGGLTVDEVSRLLGYSEPAAFSRAFKRWAGVRPRVYREEPAARTATMRCSRWITWGRMSSRNGFPGSGTSP